MTPELDFQDSERRTGELPDSGNRRRSEDTPLPVKDPQELEALLRWSDARNREQMKVMGGLTEALQDNTRALREQSQTMREQGEATRSTLVRIEDRVTASAARRVLALVRDYRKELTGVLIGLLLVGGAAVLLVNGMTPDTRSAVTGVVTDVVGGR